MFVKEISLSALKTGKTEGERRVGKSFTLLLFLLARLEGAECSGCV